jgi:cell division protein FtsW (lipid II flippase)
MTTRRAPASYHRVPRYQLGPKPKRRTELGLLVFGWVIITGLYVLASMAHSSKIPPHLGPFLAILFALTVVAHMTNRWLVPNAHPVVLPIVVLLNGMGYVVIARYDPTFAAAQAGWTALGVFFYVGTLLAIRRTRDLDRYRYLLLLLAGILILLPLSPLGNTFANSNGARLWIHFGSLEFQPVEIGKVLLCIFFASYFAEKKELLTIPTARIGNRLVLDPRPLIPILAAFGFAMLVIAKESDIGFALLIFTLFITLLWITTGRIGYIVFGLLLFAVGAFVAAHLFSQFHERVTLWLDPWSYTSIQHICQAANRPAACLGGDQLANGWYALGLGGVGGVGIGLGHASAVSAAPGLLFIYALTSDMIFAAIGYQFGLMGTTAVAIGFLLLVGTGLRIAQTARSDFARLVAVGLTALLGFQAFFIMAGVTRLLPLTGITLPFMAYGGSSLITNYVLVALLMRVSEEGSATLAERSSGIKQPGERAFTAVN